MAHQLLDGVYVSKTQVSRLPAGALPSAPLPLQSCPSLCLVLFPCLSSHHTTHLSPGLSVPTPTCLQQSSLGPRLGWGRQTGRVPPQRGPWGQAEVWEEGPSIPDWFCPRPSCVPPDPFLWLPHACTSHLFFPLGATLCVCVGGGEAAREGRVEESVIARAPLLTPSYSRTRS